MHLAFSWPVSSVPALYSCTPTPISYCHTGTTIAEEAYLSKRYELRIILQEECQILIRNIHLRVAPELPMLFLRLASARESVLVDLILDLVRRVAHEDARIWVRRAHLRLRPLECREEPRVQEGGLRVFELLRDVAREAEVRVLVYGTRDEARDVRRLAEDVRE